MFLCNYARQRSGIYIVAVFACLLITLTMIGGCTSSRNEKAEKVRQGMTAYLQERYGIEFEVGQPYLTGSMSTTHYQAKAHPKGKPEIEFIINDNSYMDEMGSGVYGDYYLEAKWSYQGKQEVEKKLREVYGKGADLRIKSYKFGGGSYSQKDLDYTQIFEKKQGKGEINLRYDVFLDGTEFNKEDEVKKAYPILKSFILDFGTDNYGFDVVYVDKSFKQDYLASPKPYMDNWRVHHGIVRFSEAYKKEIEDKKLLGRLLIDSLSKPAVIESDSDLENYINVRGE